MAGLEAGIDQSFPDVRQVDLLRSEKIDALSTSNLCVQSVYEAGEIL
jgi:hypothetical protein